jgi:hypothetical protein
MSGFASAPVVAQTKRATAARSHSSGINPLEALERGFALFRSTFEREAWRYYAGAAPFVLCFILMWVLNGQIRISDVTLLLETAALAVAYLLRIAMVARYVQGVRQCAFGVPRVEAAGAFARIAAMGRLLTRKITLGIAALATLPTFAGAPWFYGACQFASLEAGEDCFERHTFGGCLALAGQWYGNSLLLYLMFFPLWVAAWLNAFLLALIVPQLLQSIFGLNTLLSTQMGLYSLLRSYAFWFSLFAAVWLALDPIVKCTYVIVYQHLKSRLDGDDLRGILAGLPRQHQQQVEILTSAGAGQRAAPGSAAVLAIILSLVCLTPSVSAAQNPIRSANAQPDSAPQERIQKLRRSIDQESQRAIYRWHDADHPTPPTWFERMLARIGEATSRGWTAFSNFLRKLWPSAPNPSPGQQAPGGLKNLRFWLVIVAIFTLAVGGVLFWLRRRGEAVSVSADATVEPLPDLGETAVASERSEDEWFALAERLEGAGDLRLALRAAYLGLLAGLAQREWLTIRRDRTNREYLEEFTRRWRRRPQAAVAAHTETAEELRTSLRLFDRVWYGSYVLTPSAVAAYRQGQRELLSHV